MGRDAGRASSAGARAGYARFADSNRRPRGGAGPPGVRPRMAGRGRTSQTGHHHRSSRALKITILTQYYPPETGAPQNRLSDLARRMTDAGHAVTVLTGKPNYPTGRIHREFRGGLWKTRHEDGVRIIHCWLFASRSKRVFLRLANYFS